MLNVSAKLPIDDKKISDRLNRAYDIVRMLGSGYSIKREIERDNDVVYYTVHKESTSLLEDNSVYYTVIEDMCSCPDAPTARGNLCKHRLAVKLIEEMGRN
jgi:predicted nucleic acid-binding Zn finger protein